MNQSDHTTPPPTLPEMEVEKPSNGLNRLIRQLGTLVAVGLLIYLLSLQGWYEILGAIQQIPLWRFTLAIVLMIISRLAVTGRWHVLLHSVSIPIPLSQSLHITFAGLFASNFLPTTVGGDVMRIALTLRLGFDRAICTASVFVDRLVGMAGMASAVPFGLQPLLASIALNPTIPEWLPWAGTLPLSKRLWGRGRQLLQRLIQTSALWIKTPRSLLLSFIFTWIHMLSLFSVVWLFINGMGENISLWLTSGLWSFTYFVTLLPFSINGYGLQEVSMTFIFSSLGGVSVQNSLTAALLVRTLQIIASLPGAVFLPDILVGLKSEE